MTARRALAAAAVAVLLTGCNAFNDQRGRGDAPIATEAVDDTAAEVINFPDYFMNFATKCNHGNRLYAHTRDAAAPLVVPADPSCPQPDETPS